MKWVILEQSPSGVVVRPQAVDKEGDKIAFAVTWYKNGKVVEGQRTARLRPTIYRVNDAIFVDVVPSDLYGQGKPMRSRELIIKAEKTKLQ